jgi:hypothetical protein
MSKLQARLVLAAIFVILFAMSVRCEPLKPSLKDPCAILREEETVNGSFMQWCDLDNDGEADLIQEIIRGEHGESYIIDIIIPGTK